MSSPETGSSQRNTEGTSGGAELFIIIIIIIIIVIIIIITTTTTTIVNINITRVQLVILIINMQVPSIDSYSEQLDAGLFEDRDDRSGHPRHISLGDTPGVGLAGIPLRYRPCREVRRNGIWFLYM